MASKFKMPQRQLLIKWTDASSIMQSNGAWKSWKKLHKEAEPATIFSMGYLVKDEPGFIVLTSQLCEEDGANDGNVTILRENIREAWELTIGGKYDSEKEKGANAGAKSSTAPGT